MHFLDFVKLEMLGFCIIHYKTTKENMSKIALETEVYMQLEVRGLLSQRNTVQKQKLKHWGIQ